MFSEPLAGAELNRFRDYYRSEFLQGKSLGNESTGRFGRALTHLGFLGAAVSTADIAGSFHRSPEAGLKRASECGVDFLGYECGSSLISKISTSLPARWRIPLVVIGGIAGSFGCREIFDSLEESGTRH